jgi:hypothetical protein
VGFSTVDFATFFSGLIIGPKSGFAFSSKLGISHTHACIANYVEALGELQSPPRRFLADSGLEADVAFAVVVNFALHAMAHKDLALVFGDPGHGRKITLEGNDEKMVMFSLRRASILAWMKLILAHPRTLKPWFNKHVMTAIRAETLVSTLNSPVGVVGVHRLDEPARWAYWLQHNTPIIPGGWIIGSGAPDHVAAFVTHLDQGGRLLTHQTRNFLTAPAPWAVCICQLGARQNADH